MRSRCSSIITVLATVVLGLAVLAGPGASGSAAAPDPSPAVTPSGAEIYASVRSTCAPTATEGVIHAEISVSADEKDVSLSLPWTLTGPDGSDHAGTVAVSERTDGDVDVAGLAAQDTYSLRVYDEGADPATAEPVVTVTVIVASCLQAESTCETVRFSNPAGNPDINVELSEDDFDPDEDMNPPIIGLVVKGGESVDQRVPYPHVHWETWVDYGLNDATKGSVGGGTGDLDIAQGCAPPPFDLSTRCASRGGSGAIEITATHRGDEYVQLGLHGSGAARFPSKIWNHNGATSSTWSAKGRPGGYLVTMYLDPGGEVEFASAEFRVARCVEVAVTSTEVTFTNPKGNLAVDVTFEGVGRTPKAAAAPAAGATVRVAAGRSSTRAWSGSDVRWSAAQVDPTAGPGSVVEAAGSGIARVAAVPTPTPSPAPSAESGPVPEPGQEPSEPTDAPGTSADGAGLADTGADGPITGLGLAAVVAIMLGAVVLVGRRRSE